LVNTSGTPCGSTPLKPKTTSLVTVRLKPDTTSEAESAGDRSAGVVTVAISGVVLVEVAAGSDATGSIVNASSKASST
jgi:hypothetical protein